MPDKLEGLLETREFTEQCRDSVEADLNELEREIQKELME